MVMNAHVHEFRKTLLRARPFCRSLANCAISPWPVLWWAVYMERVGMFACVVAPKWVKFCEASGLFLPFSYFPLLSLSVSRHLPPPKSTRETLTLAFTLTAGRGKITGQPGESWPATTHEPSIGIDHATAIDQATALFSGPTPSPLISE